MSTEPKRQRAEAWETINADDPAPFRVDLKVDEYTDRIVAWCDTLEDAQMIACALSR